MGSQQQKEQTPVEGCTKQGCTMMFSCVFCGFIVIEPLTIKPGPSTYIEQSVFLYKIGSLSAFNITDWKPPKTC